MLIHSLDIIADNTRYKTPHRTTGTTIVFFSPLNQSSSTDRELSDVLILLHP